MRMQTFTMNCDFTWQKNNDSIFTTDSHVSLFSSTFSSRVLKVGAVSSMCKAGRPSVSDLLKERTETHLKMQLFKPI